MFVSQHPVLKLQTSTTNTPGLQAGWGRSTPGREAINPRAWQGINLGEGRWPPGPGKGSSPERWTYAACIGICRGKSPPWSPGLLLKHNNWTQSREQATLDRRDYGRAERDIYHKQGDTGHGTAMGGEGVAVGRGGRDTHHTHSDTKSQCNQLEGGAARVRSHFVCVGFIPDLKKLNHSFVSFCQIHAQFQCTSLNSWSSCFSTCLQFFFCIPKNEQRYILPSGTLKKIII